MVRLAVKPVREPGASAKMKLVTRKEDTAAVAAGQNSGPCIIMAPMVYCHMVPAHLRFPISRTDPVTVLLLQGESGTALGTLFL